jgi:hypothetical protein
LAIWRAGFSGYCPSLLRGLGHVKKENDMDWNAIFFAVVLPVFIFGAVGLGVYAQRLPG